MRRRPRLAQWLEQRLEAVRAEATAPRNLYKVVFPGDFSLRVPRLP
jgi:hypothetical protein